MPPHLVEDVAKPRRSQFTGREKEQLTMEN